MRLRAAMRMPTIEALFPAPWPAAARLMLPSSSPQATATELWGPIIAWCALQLLAEGIDPEQPQRAALDLFDRLRLREPLARAVAALGFEGEEPWRVSARIKVLLLTAAIDEPLQPAPSPAAAEPTGSQPPHDLSDAAKSGIAASTPVQDSTVPASSANPPKGSAPAADSSQNLAAPPAHDSEKPESISPSLWLDPDVRWLCGIHQAEGHHYLIRERYEELLWWLLMPALLRLAGERAPSRAVVAQLSNSIDAALQSAKAAGYRIDTLLGGKPSSAESALDDARVSDKNPSATPQPKPAAPEVEPAPPQANAPKRKN
jgi:hypothetical protein